VHGNNLIFFLESHKTYAGNQVKTLKVCTAVYTASAFVWRI